MRPVFKRIAVNGVLTAALLGMVGYGFAELAGFWLAAQPADRAAPLPTAAGTPAADPVADSLRTRVPLTMAAWGFVFVAVGEFGLQWWRRGRPAAPAKAAPPDPAEVLLEEIMRQVEEGRAKAEPARPAAPSPSAAGGENTPAPELVPGGRVA